jgi:hypothetical protein
MAATPTMDEPLTKPEKFKDETSSESKTQRVQIEFSQDAANRLRQIKELSGATSNADVMRNALRFYDWFLKQQNDGWSLQLRRGDAIREVEIVF